MRRFTVRNLLIALSVITVLAYMAKLASDTSIGI